MSKKRTAGLAAGLALGLLAWIAWLRSDGVGPDAGAGAVREPSAPVAAAPDASDQGSNAASGWGREPGERDSETGREPLVTGGFALRVRDEEGRPVARAEVLLLAAHEEPVRAESDGSGLARFDAAGGPAWVVARAEGHVPAALEIAVREGEHEIVLERGRSLSGRVIEDGGLPRDPVRLTLRSDGGPLDALPLELREIATRVLELAGERAVEADAFGGFAFDALPSEWSGALELPPTHWILAAPPGASLREWRHELVFQAPIAGLEISTMRLHAVRGRIVWSDSGAPVSGAALQVYAEFVDGAQTPSMGCRAGADGRFVIGLASGSSADRERWKNPARRPALARVQLSIAPPGGMRRDVDLAADALGRDGDAGDIAVERGRSVHFLVRDLEDRPVPGAIAQAEARSEPTDAQGRGVLQGVPLDARQVLVGAREQRALAFPLGPGGETPETPLVFVLPPGNRIELALVDPGGAPPLAVQLELACERPLFAGGEGALEQRLHYAILDHRMLGATWTHESVLFTLEIDAHGRTRLSNLRDGVAFVARVVDRWDQALVEERFFGPSGGERLERTLLVPGAPFSLAGRVVDSDGARLTAVEIELRVGSGLALATTDPDGSYVLSDLRAAQEPGAIRAALRGYATARLEGIAVEEGSELPELVLERGRELVVLIVDEAGAPIDAASVRAGAPGFADVYGERIELGVVKFADLPPRALTVTVFHGLRRYERVHVPPAGEMRFVLPVHGSLELIAPRDAPRFEKGDLEARVTAAGEPAVSESVRFEGDVERSTRALELLPGVYRVELAHGWWNGSERVVEPLPGRFDVEVRAGERATVRLGE